MSFEPELPWDSPKFRERKDTPWIAGCRWLQSWWREQQGIQPGERTDISESLVGAMFPVGTDAECNFFGPNVIAALEERVINGADFGVVPTEVLFRNLLETQVLTFNLIGEFWREPAALLPWVCTVDPDATEVCELRIEWTPERRSHLGGGPGFDGFVDYRAGRSHRFLALELAYAEDRTKNKTTVRPQMAEAAEASPQWRDGASRRLDRASLRSLWITTLVAQTHVANEDYDQGRVVAMGCAADDAMRVAANFVRAELNDPDRALVVSSLDAFVDALAPAHPEWARWIRTRYLDFAPVAHLLAKNDPRRGNARRPKVASGDLRRLVEVGQKVSGNRTQFARVLQRLDDGDTDATQVAALEARAAELVTDLEAFWQALAGLEG